MMNMSFRVGGLACRLRLKTKTRKEAAAAAPHICE
jgi:hypothetical protein